MIFLIWINSITVHQRGIGHHCVLLSPAYIQFQCDINTWQKGFSAKIRPENNTVVHRTQKQMTVNGLVLSR